MTNEVRRYMSEELGEPGVFDCLEVLSEWGPGSTAQEIGLGLARVAFDVEEVFDRLGTLGIVLRDGNGRLTLSSRGSRMLALLRGLNGSPLGEVVRSLGMTSDATPKYSLLTQGMADFFVQSLYDRPDFGRILICSPWVSFTERTLGLLTQALYLAGRSGHQVDIYVLTRANQGGVGVESLLQLGANMSYRADLHTKLYIRDPAPSGGQALAIVGSQNLTRSNYTELGIAIRNDSVLTTQLLAYFFTLFANPTA